MLHSYAVCLRGYSLYISFNVMGYLWNERRVGKEIDLSQSVSKLVEILLREPF
jgi:hypothetical protein